MFMWWTAWFNQSLFCFRLCQSFNGMELLDLLFEQADNNSGPEEPEGALVNLAWPFPDQSVSIVEYDTSEPKVSLTWSTSQASM